MFLIALVCLSVCLSISNIARKRSDCDEICGGVWGGN